MSAALKSSAVIAELRELREVVRSEPKASVEAAIDDLITRLAEAKTVEEKALDEAQGTLLVISDPAAAWGTRKTLDAIREYASNAHRRLGRVRRGEPEVKRCSVCGEEQAGPTGRCRRCERSLEEERMSPPYA